MTSALLDPGTQALEVRVGDLEVTMVLENAINYALAHNDISPLRALVIRNHGGEAIANATFALSLDVPLERAVVDPLRLIIPDILPGEVRNIPIHNHRWHFDPVAIAALDEAVTGRVHLVVEHDGDEATSAAPLRLLARDEWWAVAVPETIAAFVTPRDRAVMTLLDEASVLLKERTGSSSLEGYQANSERVMAITGAIYDAMRARNIRYIDPPPSFEGTGQRIRRPSEVLEDRFGTCLDLATTFASVVEAAGLNPVIFLYRGHAFAGVLTEDQHFPEGLVLSEPASITTWVDAKLLVPVETTMLCETTSATFEQAVDQPRTYGRFSHGADDAEYAVDVRNAHLNGVRPLPVVRATGEVVIEAAPAAPSVAGYTTATSTPAGAPPTVDRGSLEEAVFPPRIARWRNSLLDMSLNNPLLNMRRGGKGTDLHIPTGLLGHVEDQLIDGQEFTLVPSDRIAEIHRAQGARSAQDMPNEQLERILRDERGIFAAVTDATYDRKLRELMRTAKSVQEETGANNLFVTFGTLHWKDGAREVRSPLFVLPVTLRAQRKGPFKIALDDGGYTLPNQCLVEKLRMTLGFVVPEFEKPLLDESGIDLDGSIQAIRRAIIERALPFTVEEESRLAILQFSTLELWQDMSENWEQFLDNAVVRHLVETPTDSFQDPVAAPPSSVTDEARVYAPIPADGSQLEAIVAAGAGRSFVLEGPPGTGKSQTITNLITHALATGKRVLFVAEKQAALDVVKRRLEKVGIGDLCLDLHGKQQSPAEVRAQLGRALEVRAAGSADTWETLLAQYENLVTSLSRYPAALHEIGGVGLSAWTARQTLLAAGQGPEFDVPREVVSSRLDTAAVYEAARDLGNALFDLGGSIGGHAWSLAGEVDVTDLERRRAIVDATRTLIEIVERIGTGPVRELIATGADAESLAAVADWMELLADTGIAVDLDAARSDQRADATRVARDAAAELRSDAASLMATVQPAALLLADLDGMVARARAADATFILFRGKAQRAVAAELAGVLRPGAQLPGGLVTATVERIIATRTVMREVRAKFAAIPGIDVVADWNPLEDDADATVDRQLHVLDATARVAASLADVDDDLLRQVAAASSAEVASTARSFADTWNDMVSAIEATPEQVAAWQGDAPSLLHAIDRSRLEWRDDVVDETLLRLGRWVRVLHLLRQLTKLGLAPLVDAVQLGQLPPDDIETAARRSIARAALRERLGTTVLASFDGAERDRRIDDFVQRGNDVREEMFAELPARIVAGRSFDATSRVGKVGKFVRELEKKRKAMKVRELFAEYGSIIGELTPCLMMSPHSVARFLPAGAVGIDIVVFDEASQIRVEEAIGAMGRGASTVIVGDSLQMPPTSVGKAGSGSDDEDEEEDERFVGVPADMESVLSEGVQSNLEQIWLSWHYRSQDESLIAFSNQQYYKERLASFPAPPEVREGLGISMVRLEGRFDRTGRRNVNEIEADTIVAEIRRRLTADPSASIGVITMNANQMRLIADKLESLRDPLVEAALSRDEDKVFVKNLENVQGDEADSILFSLAFAPDPDGGKMPLNFGPLTHVGGERRLNVAVTRARRDVVIYTSFDPEHIDLNRTKAVGMAHLRMYMELARNGAEASAVLRSASARNHHLDEVVEQLTEAGLIVRRDIGLSDFKVDLAVAIAESGPWVAVFLDGPEYASRAIVGDRESVPHAVLVGAMGWSRVERVWLPSWLAEQDTVVDRIVAAAKLPRPEPAVETPAPVAAEIEPTVPEPAADTTKAYASAPPMLAPVDAHPSDEHDVFDPASDDIVRSDKAIFDRLHDPTTRAEVVAQITAVVRDEGPVTGDRLARVVARRFDWSRLTGARIEQILRLVPPAMRAVDDAEMVVWPIDVRPGDYRAFRVAARGTKREVADVPTPELINAMCHLAETGHGVEHDELLRETARLFGISQVGKKVRERLELVLKTGIRVGRLVDDGDVITIAPAE